MNEIQLIRRNRQYKQNERGMGKEELALKHEIQKYKENYLHKHVHSLNIESFIKFSKENFLLMTSYCKNIIFAAPQKLSVIIDELSVMYDDMSDKFYQMNLKIHDKFGDLVRGQNKIIGDSKICAICQSNINKVEINQVKKHFLNEADLRSAYLDDDGASERKKYEEDIAFFTQVNDLLNNKQGQIVRNQIQIGIYQDVALNAIKSFISLKDSFSRENLFTSNMDWIEKAKKEMKMIIQNNFKSKVPPWIARMFTFFHIMHRKQSALKQHDIETQTSTSYQTEIMETKRKNVVFRQKLEILESKYQNKQKQVHLLAHEKVQLDNKIDYYKLSLNKLIEDIENMKTENMIIKMKLNSKTNNLRDQNSIDDKPSSRSIMLSSTQRLNQSENDHKKKKGLRSSSKKSSAISKQNSEIIIKASREKRQSQTSITKMESTHQQRKSRYSIKKDNLTPINTNFHLEYLNSIKQNVEIQKNQTHDFSTKLLKPQIIHEEQAETTLQEDKKRIKDISIQMQQKIKQSYGGRNDLKRFFSNTLSLNNVKQGLKRVARRTNKLSTITNSFDVGNVNQNSGLNQGSNASPLIESMIEKIYNQLKQSNYLNEAVSEQQFKAIVSSINANANANASLSIRNNEDSKEVSIYQRLNPIRINQRLSISKRQWQEQNLMLSFKKHQQYGDYFELFENQATAYNYECSLTKNHYKGSHKLTKQQQQTCLKVYNNIKLLKINNKKLYRYICSYIRYPFQTIKNDFTVLNLVNDMSYNSFQLYFQKILLIHRKCEQIKPDLFCKHIETFIQKITTDHVKN